MFKKVLTLAVLCSITTLGAYGEVSQKDMEAAYGYYEQAEKYSKGSQYSSAITELKKGLRLNPYDANIRIGLINNHLLRATYYNNKSKEYNKAMNDLRAALFYLKYYGSSMTDPTALKAIKDNESNLNYLYNQTQIATNLKNRYQIAKNLRRDGEFAASAYEFIQASKDNSIAENCNIQVGDLAIILGNQQLASDYYKQALALNKNNAITHLKLAKAYDNLGEASLANTEYNYTLEKSDNNRGLLLDLESIWIKKIGTNPNNAEAHTNLGAVYQKLGDNQRALQEYTKALSINPRNITTRFNIATLFQIEKQYEQAIQAYNNVLALNPKATKARYYKAQCLCELKNFSQATDEYKKILELEPNNTEVKSLMLEAMRHSSTPEEMLNNYAQASQNGPVSASTVYDYAYELHKANRLDEAIANYNKAISLEPKNADCYLNLAQAYKQKGDFAQASKTIAAGISALPENEELKAFSKNLKEEISAQKSAEASALFKDGRYSEAVVQYEAMQPKTAEIYTNIGACYQAMNEDKKAINAYKQAFSKDPNNWETAFYLGQTYSNLEDWANARTYLAKALSLKPNDTNIKELYTYVTDQQDQIALDRALDMYSKGDYLNALAVLNNIITQNKNNPFAYYYRGLIYDAQKKYSLALNEYQKVVSISDLIPEAYYSLALDCEYLKRYKEAYMNYQKYMTKMAQDNEYTKYAKGRIEALKQYAY